MPRAADRNVGSAFFLHLFYDVFYVVSMLLVSPYVLFKMVTRAKWRFGLARRLGRVEAREGDQPCLLVHGVSVGELLAAAHFIELFRARHPDWKVVVSTTTPTGYSVAKRHYGDLDVIFYPLDLSNVVRRVLRRIRPSLVILIELEIWPNFLVSCGRSGIPVALINGRISDRSYRGYRFWRRFLGGRIRQISLFCVQNKKYAARLRALGVEGRSVRVTGTMKYDTIVASGVGESRKRMLDELRIPEGAKVLIGGSTHPPEERILLDAFGRLVDATPDLILVLAPRRPERVDEVEALIADRGLRSVRRSRLDRGATGSGDVLLVDTVGELSRIYAAADIVFVGGSLIPHGGQNMMEPAGLGRAVLFGSYVRNFQDSVDLLLENDAALMVRDGDDLLLALRTLLANPKRIEEMGSRAQAVIRDNQGASRRNLESLHEAFEDVFDARSVGVGVPGGTER